MSKRTTQPCPQCKFPNIQGASRCLGCGEELGTAEYETLPQAVGGAITSISRPEFGSGTHTLPTAGDEAEDTVADVPEEEETVQQPRVSESGRFLGWEESPALAPTLAWLRCDPLPPIPLGSRPAVTLGRSDECDLVLPHASVSRVHAVLRVLGRELVFEDSSRFGSRVNGRPVHSTRLEVGDVLTVGPYEISIVANPEDDRAQEEDGTQPLEFSEFRHDTAAQLTGELDKIPIAEVFQQLEFTEKTGTLKISNDQAAGLLALRQGRPLYAKFDGRYDDEAVLAMLGVEAGRFSFFGDVEPGAVTMTSSLTSILLEASRRLDEGSSEETSGGA